MTELGQLCRETLLRAARPDGFIGHTIFWDHRVDGARVLFYNVVHQTDRTTATIEPPPLAFAWRIAVGDPALEPRIVAHHAAITAERDFEGDGLVWILQPDEFGLDASPQVVCEVLTSISMVYGAIGGGRRGSTALAALAGDGAPGVRAGSGHARAGDHRNAVARGPREYYGPSDGRGMGTEHSAWSALALPDRAVRACPRAGSRESRCTKPAAETGGNSMSEGMEFRIGSDVTCSDGPCGELKRVVVDPAARAITHLAVQPRHRRGSGRLVPVDLVASTGRKIELRCTKSEFEALDEAEETRLLPGATGEWGGDDDQMSSLPYYGLGTGAVGMGVGGMSMGGGGLGLGIGGVGSSAGPHAVTSDRIPVGEVEVRRGDQVHATDGTIGRVRGLVVDPSDHHVTHFLLDEGHLWGEKQVAIPISAVTNVDDGVRVSLTKHEVRDLPPVDLDHPD